MGRPQSPCHHCPKRYVGCKSTCPDWDTFESEKLAFRNQIAKEKFKYKEVDNFRYYAMQRTTHK